MKRILAIALLSLSLAGCAGTKAGEFIASIKSAASGVVTPESLYIARNAFDTVEISATNYLSLKKCPVQAPFCRDRNATAKLIPALRLGRDARNKATQFLKDHPNELGAQDLYDGLTLATSTVKEILAQYHGG